MAAADQKLPLTLRGKTIAKTNLQLQNPYSWYVLTLLRWISSNPLSQFLCMMLLPVFPQSVVQVSVRFFSRWLFLHPGFQSFSCEKTYWIFLLFSRCIICVATNLQNFKTKVFKFLFAGNSLGQLPNMDIS